MIRDLFEEDVRDVRLAPGAMLLGGFALRFEAPCVTALQRVVEVAPFRHMVTPGGHRMSVAMTNCGTAGWVTDRTGYRYDSHDPLTGRRWPAMPDVFADLAAQAAARAGFDGFAPDACLINRYEPGARLSLHQDKNERDFSAPIVSVSLGLPAVFLLGGLCRADTPRRVPLAHGDVVVWGGPARLRHHGVFAGRRRTFDVPLDLQLSHGFRRTILSHLPEIGYGETASYAAIAKAAGNPKAVRAAGSACASNPLPVVVPCHRVVRSDGTIGQYVGGVDAKRALLTLEGAA